MAVITFINAIIRYSNLPEASYILICFNGHPLSTTKSEDVFTTQCFMLCPVHQIAEPFAAFDHEVACLYPFISTFA